MHYLFIVSAGLRGSKRVPLHVPRQVAPAGLRDRDRWLITEWCFPAICESPMGRSNPSGSQVSQVGRGVPRGVLEGDRKQGSAGRVREDYHTLHL